MKGEKSCLKDEPNRQTRLTNMWLIESGIAQVEEMARHASDIDSLADSLRVMFEDCNPLTGQSGLYADLLTGALCSVDWRYLASLWWDFAHWDEIVDEWMSQK